MKSLEARPETQASCLLGCGLSGACNASGSVPVGGGGPSPVALLASRFKCDDLSQWSVPTCAADPLLHRAGRALRQCRRRRGRGPAMLLAWSRWTATLRAQAANSRTGRRRRWPASLRLPGAAPTQVHQLASGQRSILLLRSCTRPVRGFQPTSCRAGL